MSRYGRALFVAALLLPIGCGDRTATATAPSQNGPATQPPPPRPPTDSEQFEVSGIVTNDRGNPVAGAVVTMAHYNGGVIHWPSTVADTSGAYRISFSGEVLRRTVDRFVARAEVVAEGHELSWYSVTQPLTSTGPHKLIGNFRLYPIKRVRAGDSAEVTFPSDVGECTGWVAERCGVVRVTIPSTGTLTVEVTPTDQSPGQPTLEICCVSGNEIYGNPLTLTLDGLRGSELAVYIGLRRGSTVSESFVVKTALRPN